MLHAVKSKPDSVSIKTQLTLADYDSLLKFKDKSKVFRAGLLIVDGDTVDVLDNTLLPDNTVEFVIDVSPSDFDKLKQLTSTLHTNQPKVLRTILKKGIACMAN